jgi:MFS family permease
LADNEDNIYDFLHLLNNRIFAVIGGKMYTLEDDEETSSRLQKQGHITDEAQMAGTFDAPPSDDTATAPPELSTPGMPHIPTSPLPESQPAIQPVTTLSSPTSLDPKNRRLALAALTIACIAVFFTSLDQTVVVTALPQIITNLQIPITQLDHAAWIVSAYLLGFVVAMPLMGRVSDMYGRRRIFLLCLSIFGLGSIFCGLAPSLGQAIDISFLSALHIDTSSPGLVWLIAARLFQAVGGGALVPIAMALAGDFYGHERRGLALGIIGAMTEAGGALGPLYGAIIVEHLGWQAIFYLNVPIVLTLLIAGWFFIPRGKRLHERIDWLGAGLLAVALTCLSLGLAQQGSTLSPSTPGSSAPENNPIMLGLALVFLLAFVFREIKARWPVVELALFRRLTFSASALVSMFVGAALIIAMADIPIFVDTVMQGKVLDSGLALLRMTAMIPLGALLGGWLCARITCRFTGILGLLFTAAGFFLMSRWPIQVSGLQMTISTITAGFGFGLVIAPISTTAINSARARQAGMSSSIVTALRMIGMILGLAALTSWALAYFKNLARAYPALQANPSIAQFAAWSKGYAQHLIQSAHIVYCAVFFFSMILCLIAIIPALFLWGRQAVAIEPIEHVEPEAETLVDLAAATTGPIPLPEVIRPRKSRRRRVLVVSLCLLVLLIGGLATYMLTPDDESSSDTTGPITAPATTPGSLTTDDTPVSSGPRQIQLALDGGALTSIFVQQLQMQPGTLSNLMVTPLPNDGLALTLELHIDSNGIHRVMPIELDGTLGVDQQQNLQLHIYQLKRDGIPANPQTASGMQTAINQLFSNTVMPALRGQLKGVKLVSVHTSTSLPCSKGAIMLVIQVVAPPIQGVAAQAKPLAFCFKGPIDINKLLSN